jgi:phosphoenolpyruvate carboxykinase (ATP)
VEIVGQQENKVGLDAHGLTNVACAYWNLKAPDLYEEAILRGEGLIAEGGPLVVVTGEHTGRSAKDKFIVKDEGSAGVDWGDVNASVSPEHFEALYRRIVAYFQGRDVFVQDLFGGADSKHRLPVRIITEHAWHSLFARNMLISPSDAELKNFAPEFTIIQAPDFDAVPAIDGSRGRTAVYVNFARKMILICGTSYAGEIKKSVFSILNHLLPPHDVMPMHCSANIGPDGDTAIFFGLSGTGKTTLSADASRTLIGDDEHGWGDSGVFNFEGGCYAKMIHLSAEAEPEIYATTKRFGTVLENVIIDPDTRQLDLDDGSLTENTRGAYPISFIPNASDTGIGGHPKNVIMLTADAFGVLPPIARLSPSQAMYHFLSGYTAKVAGTEKGLGKEPQATFSTCFGAPFMSRHPSVYGNLLRKKIAEHNVSCWLVNTGWSGGEYGVGKRMSIKHTRALLRAALDGSLNKAEFVKDPNFGFEVPTACPGVPSEILNPRNTWADKAAYDKRAKDLVGRFIKNFAKYEAYVDEDVKAAAPTAA